MYSLAETPHPPPLPRIWAHIRGRYWSAKIDDISLQPPGRKRKRLRLVLFIEGTPQLSVPGSVCISAEGAGGGVMSLVCNVNCTYYL